MRAVAIVLIAIGVVALAYGSISFTHPKKVIDLGAVEVFQEKRETIPLSPVAGGIFLVSGIVLLTFPPRT